MKLKDNRHILCLLNLFIGVSVSLAAVVPDSSSGGSAQQGRTFHGTIREDAESGDEVLLDSDLRAVDVVKGSSAQDRVCGYTVYKTGIVPLPFKVVLLDRKSGAAKIVVATGVTLDFEQKQSYDFDVAADDCTTGAHGPRDHIHVAIDDVNEFAPEWKDQTYVAEVTEGVIENEILRLDAADADGSETFSKICHYHLLTPDVPFIIGENGYLRNTEKLDYSIKHNFILEIKAEDCGGRLSDKLLVNVLVKPACKTGWTGVVDHIDYALGSGRQLLAPNATLELCDDVACQPSKVTVTIKLEVAADVDQCEIDSESINARNQFCGASPEAVDLLKLAPASDTPESGVFDFDGKSVAVDVSHDVAFGSDGLAPRFTIATWLKHDHGEDEEVKQHVVCSADAEGMNRHHFSIFVHNCRLVLLLRQEPGPDVDLNVFKPAEWRWKLSQVCDGAWHHYAISVDFPQVRLYVDGRLFVADKHNSAVIDDWPLHPTKKVKGTRLVVGACWEGVGHHLSQYLRGQLAGLVVLNNHTEADHVIQCINSCEEKLDFHAINEMETGMSLSMNSDMSRLSINGHTKDGVEKLVGRIGYVNTHTKPLVGTSTISLETSITCAEERDVPVPVVKVAVTSAVPKPKYIVTLGGTTQMVREEHDVSHGTAIFRDLLILTVPASDADSEISEETDQASLDSCTVQVEPQMSEEMEHIRIPENLLKQLGISAAITTSGLVLTGEGKTADYVEVLRGVHFVHNRPEDINMRTFRLTCVELKNHYASNQLSVQLNVVHKDPEQPEPVQPHAIGVDKLSHNVPSLNLKMPTDVKVPAVAANPKYAAESSGAGIAVIAVVCVGFLVFLIILGIARIRTAQRRTVEVNMDDRQEMEWDNSALNITVNPMDREAAYDESEMNGLQAVADSDAESDDDIGSFHDDGPDSSEQEAGDDDDADVGSEHGGNAGKTKDHDLEWDSSTVSY